MTLRDRLPFHYAWVVVGVTCLLLLTGAGIRTAPGVLMLPLEQEFQWSRATISFAVTVNLILFGFMAPFAAAIMDRYGIRRCIIIALVLMATGVAATAFMTQVWQLILMWGVMVGSGAGFLATVLAATIAGRWFVARRGFVVGLLSAGTSTGQLIFLPMMASINAAYGWRVTVLTVAAVLAAIIVPVALLLRDRPSDIGMRPYGATDDADAPKPNAASMGALANAFATLRDGLQSRDFWLIAGGFFVCGASTSGLLATHLIPACVDHGYSELTGATLLAAMGVFNFMGAGLAGWLSDKIDSRVLLSIFYGTRGLSLIYLPFSFTDFYTMSLFAVFYGLDWIATVPPTIRLLTDSFGRDRAPVFYGWIYVWHQLGAGAVAFVAGVMRESFGTYTQAFMLSGALCLLASLAVLFIGAGRTPRRAVTPAAA